MKKAMSVLLSLSLIFAIFPQGNVYSEKNFEKNLEEITSKTKKIFSITHDYEDFHSEVSSYDDNIRYYMNWNDSSKEIPGISVEMDENVNLISYHKNYKSTEKDKTSTISIKEAEEIALKFIKEIGGKDLKEIKKVEVSINSPWNNFYNLEFYRLVEGVPFYGNGININVDKYKKEVIHYNANWDYDMDFPDKEEAIKIGKAKEILKDELGLELIYKVKNREYSRTVKDPEFYLSYGFLEKDKAVDAITGEIIIVNKYGPRAGGFDGESAKEESVSDSGLTPKEREEIEKISGIKDIDEIEKVSRKILEVDNKYKLVNSNLYSSWKNKDEFLWSLYFEREGENYESSNIVLNAKTMEIISFYKNQDYESYKDKSPVINRDEALKVAQDYLKKIVPEKFTKLEYVENDFIDYEKNLGFNFIRKEGDIYIEDDYINIGVNTVNKNIYSYDVNWYNGKLPSKGEIISKEKAYEVLFGEIGYKLSYVKIYDRDNNIWRQNRAQIKLVYDIPPNKPVNIDADQGKLLNLSGDEYIPVKAINYIDLDNSYAKDKIETLGDYGIGFDGENFNPKEEILQRDFLYLLWRGINPYREKTRDMDKIYEDLINRGIVKEDEKAADATMAKEQALAFIIRAMNYEEVANLKGIYKNVFQDSKDIKAEYIGHVNLAYGFRIVQGDGGNPPRINPKEKLTREDSATIIYNYIFR